MPARVAFRAGLCVSLEVRLNGPSIEVGKIEFGEGEVADEQIADPDIEANLFGGGEVLRHGTLQ